jgi:hypothetical protein
LVTFITIVLRAHRRMGNFGTWRRLDQPDRAAPAAIVERLPRPTREPTLQRATGLRATAAAPSCVDDGARDVIQFRRPRSRQIHMAPPPRTRDNRWIEAFIADWA